MCAFAATAQWEAEEGAPAVPGAAKGAKGSLKVVLITGFEVSQGRRSAGGSAAQRSMNSFGAPAPHRKAWGGKSLRAWCCEPGAAQAGQSQLALLAATAYLSARPLGLPPTCP